jgi:hypothetical protein
MNNTINNILVGTAVCVAYGINEINHQINRASDAFKDLVEKLKLAQKT